jgi:hypothetical protein
VFRSQITFGLYKNPARWSRYRKVRKIIAADNIVDAVFFIAEPNLSFLELTVYLGLEFVF